MPANHTDIARRDRKYISATMKMPMLDWAHEAELSRRWRERRDPIALNDLVEAHARLVVRIAAGFRSSGLPLADLIQEGNIGVIEAAFRFDPSRDVRFSTYASWWIRTTIQNFILRNSSIVRLAHRDRELFFIIRRMQKRTGGLSELDRAMLAKRSRVDVSVVERMENHLASPDQSLNATFGTDNSIEKQDMLVDPAPLPDELAEREDLRRARSQYIHKALARLSPRERRIVQLRFLKGHKVRFHDIGTQLGLSKSRVRQIEVRALQKMRGALTELPICPMPTPNTFHSFANGA